MAAVSKDIMAARDQALRYALAIAENNGISGLREEISKRGLMKLSVLAPAKEIENLRVAITERTVDIVSAISMDLLISKYEFSEEDTKEYYRLFNLKVADMLSDTDNKIEEMVKRVENATGITIDVRKGIGGLG